MTESRRGVLFGLAAYLIWGAFPLYWPLLEPGGALEILAHRVVWSLIAVVVVLTVAGSWRRLPRGKRELRLLAIAAVMIGINWGVYIWGVNHHHVVETSLGYFVNPLVTVALSVLILGERLGRLQWVAVGVAATGVIVLTVDAHRPPYIALVLATSFGCYGLIKKVVGVEPAAGLAIETVVLTPIAASYLIWLGVAGHATFASHGIGHPFLLASAGPVTAIPLLFFAGAASRIPLSTIGLMQYLTPSIQFIIGVTVRHEPLGAARLAGFGFVWVSLIIFSVDSLRRRGTELGSIAELPAMEPV